MSLLADLLSRVKHEEQQNAVPPNLAQIIEKSSKKKRVERKFIIILAVTLFLIVAGFGTVYFFESYLSSSSTGLTPSQNRPPVAAREEAAQVPSPPANQPATAQPPVAVPPATTPQASQPETKPEQKFVQKIEMKTPPPAGSRQLSRNTAGDQAEMTGEIRQPQPALQKRIPQKTGKASELAQNLKAERDLLIYTAQSYEQNKNYSQAIIHYKKALEIDPRNYLIMNNLASVLIATGTFEESIRYAKSALAHQNNYVPALINLGIAYTQAGNITEGEVYLTRARVIEPSNRTVLLNLALLYERLPNYQESYTHFQKLAEMNDIQGNLGMARVLEKQGKRAEAEKVYKSILSMDQAGPQVKQFAGERLLAISDR